VDNRRETCRRGTVAVFEVGGRTGAAYAGKSPERQAQRNGDRVRPLV